MVSQSSAQHNNLHNVNVIQLKKTKIILKILFSEHMIQTHSTPWCVECIAVPADDYTSLHKLDIKK